MWEVQPSEQRVSDALQQESFSVLCRASKRGKKVPLRHSPNLDVSLSCSEHLQARWVLCRCVREAAKAAAAPPQVN